MAGDMDDMTMRTEMPTPLRLQEARRRGQVARSADLTATVVLLSGAGVIAIFGPWVLKSLTVMTASMLSEAGAVAPAEAALRGATMQAATAFLTVAGPALLASALVAVAAGVLQVGLLATADPLDPDLARLSPVAGLRRMFSARSFARGVFGVGKVLAVGAVAYLTIKSSLGRLAAAANHSPPGMIAETGNLLAALVLRLGTVLLVLAALDWLYQRWQHRQDLKMTRREWLEDLKRMEGPQRRREMNRESRIAIRNSRR